MTASDVGGQKAMSKGDIPPIVHQRASRGRFLRHFLEMIVAMIIGMVALGTSVAAILALLGHSDLLHYAALRALLMATYMTVGMSLWMRYRGHSWPRVREMAGAMFGPFILFLIPFWGGLISGGGLLAGGHVLMLPFMLGVMLVRREEYSQDHRVHSKYPVTARSIERATHGQQSSRNR